MEEDYKRLIIVMLENINDTRTLKVIFLLVHKHYVRR